MQYRAAQELPEGSGGGGLPSSPILLPSNPQVELSNLQVGGVFLGDVLDCTFTVGWGDTPAGSAAALSGVIVNGSYVVEGHMEAITLYSPGSIGSSQTVTMTSVSPISDSAIYAVIVGPASVIGTAPVGQVWSGDWTEVLSGAIQVLSGPPQNNTPGQGAVAGPPAPGEPGSPSSTATGTTGGSGSTSTSTTASGPGPVVTLNPSQPTPPSPSFLTDLEAWWAGLSTYEKAGLLGAAGLAVYLAVR